MSCSKQNLRGTLLHQHNDFLTDWLTLTWRGSPYEVRGWSEQVISYHEPSFKNASAAQARFSQESASIPLASHRWFLLPGCQSLFVVSGQRSAYSFLPPWHLPPFRLPSFFTASFSFFLSQAVSPRQKWKRASCWTLCILTSVSPAAVTTVPLPLSRLTQLFWPVSDRASGRGILMMFLELKPEHILSIIYLIGSHFPSKCKFWGKFLIAWRLVPGKSP